MCSLQDQSNESSGENTSSSRGVKSPQDERALRRALRKNIPETQPNVDVIAVEPGPKKNYRQQKTKRQREMEGNKEKKKSRKSSSAKIKKKDKNSPDDISSDDFENPPRRKKSKQKPSSPPPTHHQLTTNARKTIKHQKRNEATNGSCSSASDSEPDDDEAPDVESESRGGKNNTYHPRKWQSYEKRMKRLSGNKEDLQFVSDLTRLESWMRSAIHDFVPNNNYKTTVMYWATQSTTAAAAMLFKRHKNELEDFILRYGSELKMLEVFGPSLRQCANNERAVQTTTIRRMYLSRQNPDTRLAENVIEGELDTTTNSNNNIRLNKNLRHLGSVEELRELLISPKMYQDKVLFDLFCTGIESGNFRQTKKRPYKPLHLLMTKAHEAHFRVELYFALSRKCYQHSNSPALYTARISMFNQVIKSVREGREKWLQAAIAARNDGLTEEQRTELDINHDEGNDSEKNVDIDEDDL
jgi:hypothetical protein